MDSFPLGDWVTPRKKMPWVFLLLAFFFLVLMWIVKKWSSSQLYHYCVRSVDLVSFKNCLLLLINVHVFCFVVLSWNGNYQRQQLFIIYEMFSMEGLTSLWDAFWEKALISHSRTRKTISLFKLKKVNSQVHELREKLSQNWRTLSGLYFWQKATIRRVLSAHAAEGGSNLLCDVTLATWRPAVALPLSAGGVE